MSKHIVDLEVGDKLEFKGPIGKVCPPWSVALSTCLPLHSLHILQVSCCGAVLLADAPCSQRAAMPW